MSPGEQSDVSSFNVEAAVAVFRVFSFLDIDVL